MNARDLSHSTSHDASDRGTTVAVPAGDPQDHARRPSRARRIQIGAVTGLATFAGLWITGRIGELVALGRPTSLVLAAGLAGILVVALHRLLGWILGRSPWQRA